MIDLSLSQCGLAGRRVGHFQNPHLARRLVTGRQNPAALRLGRLRRVLWIFDRQRFDRRLVDLV